MEYHLFEDLGLRISPPTISPGVQAFVFHALIEELLLPLLLRASASAVSALLFGFTTIPDQKQTLPFRSA